MALIAIQNTDKRDYLITLSVNNENGIPYNNVSVKIPCEKRDPENATIIKDAGIVNVPEEIIEEALKRPGYAELFDKGILKKALSAPVNAEVVDLGQGLTASNLEKAEKEFRKDKGNYADGDNDPIAPTLNQQKKAAESDKK